MIIDCVAAALSIEDVKRVADPIAGQRKHRFVNHDDRDFASRDWRPSASLHFDVTTVSAPGSSALSRGVAVT